VKTLEDYYRYQDRQIGKIVTSRPPGYPPAPPPTFSRVWHEAPADRDQHWVFHDLLFDRIAGRERGNVERQFRAELGNYPDSITWKFVTWAIDLFWSRPWRTWDHIDLVYKHWLERDDWVYIEELITTDLVHPQLRARRPYTSLFDEFCEREKAA